MTKNTNMSLGDHSEGFIISRSRAGAAGELDMKKIKAKARQRSGD